MPVPFGAPATPRPQTATAGNRTRVETLGGFHHATRPRLLAPSLEISYGVVVSTQDPESCDRGSNPRRRSLFVPSIVPPEWPATRATQRSSIGRACDCRYLRSQGRWFDSGR